MTKLDEIKARWAEWGSALGSAIDQDKCVEVPARHCERAVMAFLVGAPADVAFLLGEVERLRAAMHEARGEQCDDPNCTCCTCADEVLVAALESKS